MPPTDATFASVVEAFFQTDQELSHLWGFIDNYSQTDLNETTRTIIETFRPKLVCSSDKILLDMRFYQLLKGVQAGKSLTAAQRRSLELLVRNMEMAGVHLEPLEKKKLRAINAELSKICQRFSSNMTHSRALFSHRFTTDATLRELPPQDLAMAAGEAKKRKLAGWVFTLSPPSSQAVLRYCTDRTIRKLFYEENGKVATSGNYDNRPLALRILQLRRAKAQLLGKKDYAAWILQERMARSAREILSLLKPYASACRKKARKELAELRRFANMPRLQPWDLPYISQKYKKQMLQLSDRELREYFPLRQTLDGLFLIAEKLYGVAVRRLPASAAYQEGVLAYEMRLSSGTVGYFLADFFARPSKRVGAWSTCLREPMMDTSGKRIPPVMINVCSFAAGSNGEEPLLMHGDVETMFHEFGHAIHEILGVAPYRNLDGYRTEWDFVELPSQLMENWCWEQASLSLFAKHVHTGKPFPKRLRTALERTKKFLTGYGGLMQTEYSLLDMLLHTGEIPRTVAALDRLCLAHARKHGLLPVPASQKKYASFHHIFDGGYAAGYYSYVWAEVLEADVFAHWKKQGVLSRSIGTKFRKTVFAPGASKPGMELFHDFLGRAPKLGPLLKKQGLKR